MPPSRKPFVVKSTTARDVTIAVLAGVALLAFVLWAIVHMSQEVTGHSLLTGRIVARHFEPRPEEQLSVEKPDSTRRISTASTQWMYAHPMEKPTPFSSINRFINRTKSGMN